MTATETTISFPRQEALTRRFRLGLPRGFRVSPDGTRVVFIRSAGGRDPVGSLWAAEVADGRLAERLILDARTLAGDDRDLPAAERARRERMRETTSGITAYSADAALTRAVFSVDGVPYAVDLIDPSTALVELPHPGPVVDPQVSPDGQHATFVWERGVYLVSTDGRGPAECLCAPDTDEEAWGLADFIAAEELDRHRGLWWLPGSDALLIELVDETEVEIRWIGDPSRPEQAPVAHRYPAAGTANPVVRLFVVQLDGSRLEVAWDREAFPYLATVVADDPRGVVISVLSRDQSQQQILLLSPDSHEPRLVRTRTTVPWITLAGGVPCLAPDGRLLEIVANTVDDCFQLVADDTPLTPAGLNVAALVDVSADRIVLSAYSDPLDRQVYALGPDGDLTELSDGPGVHAATGGAGGLVVVSTDQHSTGPRYLAMLPQVTGPITSLGERPVVTPRVTFHRVGERELAAAVLWPTGHVAGSTPLPVVLTPYGGPGHSRVTHSAGAFAGDQWLADQGFAVVVIDGAGTPGRGPAWEHSVYHDLSAIVLDDQVAGLQALAAIYPDLDLTRVGITGWSFGGFLAALAVLDRPDVFHAAVAGAPCADLGLYDTAYSERYLGTPQEQPEVYAATSLVRRAAALTRPLLIIHGLADDNVLVAQTLQLSAALLAAGRPHSVLPLSGVTHMTPQEDVAENLPRLEVDFLATHLRGAGN